MSFVHLQVHTEFSIQDSVVKIPALMKKVADLKQPAIAITDTHNLFGSLKFYQAAIKEGIKPIIGATITVLHPKQQRSRLIVLCQNDTGYLNLSKLLSRCHLTSPVEGEVLAKASWINEHNEGLIAIFDAFHGTVFDKLTHQDTRLLNQCLKAWQQSFPNRFYIKLQNINKPHDISLCQQLIQIAQTHHLPLVACNHVCFLNEEDFETHEVKVCIQNNHTLSDPKRPKNYTPQQYLKSNQAMYDLFKSIPSAIENTMVIAKRCNFTFTLGTNFLPNFPLPNGEDVTQHCKHLIENKLEKHLQEIAADEATRVQYQDRLAYEMQIIESMGFTSYFLIVADFINWSKKNQIPVGPGRGSGAGSLVAFMLGITGLDPIQHGLLFERFLNPERVSMPDFDIDFCMEGRDRVIQYVTQKYGQDCVSQIITYGTMAAKAVVRDVGRVMGHPYGFVDAIAKLIPFELGMTLEKALNDEPLLKERYDKEEQVKTLIDMGIKLEGTVRNAGKHAGGVIIAPKPLVHFTALYTDPDNKSPVTHLDKDDNEKIGLVKFDFLGLRTLTIIHWAVEQINASMPDNDPLDIDHIPLTDKSTFDLLKRCETTAIFQLESRGMKDLVQRLQPDSFEEIVALVALFRPGPLQSGMVDDYIDRKHGRAQINCFHDTLIPILEPTYGVILYQEQVMQIAQVLSNYSLGGADLLRRAMGKKKPMEMAKQRQIFIDGAKQNQVSEHKAGFIFDIIEKFAGYGFNKSHSAAYALIAYQTAYLKTHYPNEYMAAVLSSDMDNSDKTAIMIDECKRMQIKLQAPCINQSDYKFTVKDDSIIYGLGAIKGVGQAAIETIIEMRKKMGPYQSLFDFCQRCDKQKVNKRVIEALVCSGAMDDLGEERATLFATIEYAMQTAEQHHRNQSAGQEDLFGNDETTHTTATPYVNASAWSPLMQLAQEKKALGLYLSGHPMAQYQRELQHTHITPIHQLNQLDGDQCITAGIISQIRTIMTKRGKKMAIVTIGNEQQKIDITVFSELFDSHRSLLVADKLVVVNGDKSFDDFSKSIRITAKSIQTIDQYRSERVRRLIITLSPSHQQSIPTIRDTLKQHAGQQCPVTIAMAFDEHRATFDCDPSLCITPSDHLIDKLNKIDGLLDSVYEY